MKIVILGCGKSTFARQLGEILHILPVLHLDQLLKNAGKSGLIRTLGNNPIPS